MKKYDVFIGYSRQDFPIVSKFIYEFEVNGLSFFYDLPGINGGAEFAEVIASAIGQSKVFVQFYSAAAAQSNWVSNEIKYAISKGLHILPVLLDNTPLPFEIAHINAIKVDNDNIEKSIDDVARAITYLLEKKIPSNDAINYEPSAPKTEESTAERQPEENEYTIPKKGGSSWKTFLYVVLFIYLALIVLAIIAENYTELALLTLPLLIGFIVIAYFHFNAKNFSLKLFCNAEDDSDIEVKIDGESIATIKAQDVVTLKRRKGNYLISLLPKSKKLKGVSFQHSFAKNNDGAIKEITLPLKLQEQNKDENIVRYKCFIGGSTSLTSERNAVRAALSQLYNKWEDENLIVSAYTFEDFSNAQHQQDRYFNFISSEAQCTIFIITDGVGPKTADEYKLAYQTYLKLKTRPMIFVYADETIHNDTVLEFKNEVLKNNSYWRGYRDIESLMSKVREDIDSDLFGIFKTELKK